MFYFYTNELHFTPEFLGRVRLAGSIASLAGEWDDRIFFLWGRNVTRRHIRHTLMALPTGMAPGYALCCQ
jgi:hypothetical protein